jgi:hypothetical protein
MFGKTFKWKIYACLCLATVLTACGGSGGSTTETATVDLPTIITPIAPITAAELGVSLTSTKNLQFTWADVPDATYYNLKEDSTGGSGFSLMKTFDKQSFPVNSFDLVVPLYERLNARYILQSCNVGGCTDSRTLYSSTIIAEMIDNIDYFKAHNSQTSDYFGQSLSLSADGNTLAVGAKDEDSHATGTDGDQTNNDAHEAGAVYVFTRVSGIWTQQAYVKASNTGADDHFGESLSLSADGNTLAVGATGEDSHATGIGGDQTDNTKNASGAVYVFTRVGNKWTQQAYVKASNSRGASWFGTSLSLSENGNALAVGAYGEGSNATGVNGNQADQSSSLAGAVYLFTRTGDVWTQEAYLKASSTGAGDYFGGTLNLSADGNTLAVGAKNESSSAKGVNGGEINNNAPKSGAIYIFTRVTGAWAQQAYLKASNTGVEDYFGETLSLSGDGNTLAVGAPWEDSNATVVNGDQTNNSASISGAVYVFTRVGGTWTQQAYLKGSETGLVSAFGSSLSLSVDGNTLTVGATGDGFLSEDGGRLVSYSGAGAVYVFKRAATTWVQQEYVMASNFGANDAFGSSVSLSGDGSVFAVGSDKEDSNATGVNGDQANNETLNSGAVYVY